MRRILGAWLVAVALIFAAGQSFGQLTTTGAGKKPSSGAIPVTLLDPDDLSTANWHRGGINVSSVAAPDGSGSASTVNPFVIDTDFASYAYGYAFGTGAITGGQQYSFTCRVKWLGAHSSWMLLAFSDGVLHQYGVWFDGNAGVFGSNYIAGSGAVISKSVISLGGGMYELNMVGTVPNDTSIGQFYYVSAAADNSTHSDFNADWTLWNWGE